MAVAELPEQEAAVVALVTAVDPIWPTISAAEATATALVPSPLSKAPEVKDVAPVPPFATATVPVTLAAVPVVFWFNVGNEQLARLPDAGVPRAGETKVGLLDSTTLPEPVEEVTPVPPLATGSVPVVPPSIGKPVALVSTADDGVPKAGATSVLFVSVCVPVSVATVESIATVTGEEPL